MMRIQKYLSQEGMCSRREAEVFIKRGLVSVNGTVIRAMGVQIDPEKDIVKILGHANQELSKKTTIIFHKPRNIASSRIQSEGKNVYDLLPQFTKLNIIGRLDKASEGLLMLSDDGVIARAVTGDHHGIEKEYEVTVREDIFPGKIRALEPGIELEDLPGGRQAVRTLPCKTQLINEHTFRIILREGRKHQIRRMCDYLHLTVTRLRRLRIGPVTLKGLTQGQFRVLTSEEITGLKKKS